MSDPSPAHRPARLTTGETAPVAAVAGWLGVLRSHLESPDLEWDGVYHLREVCLGRPIEPEQERALVAGGLLAPDGRPDPVLGAVVRAAVRGEGRVLHLDSPFTDPVDRAVADFLAARDYLAVELAPDAFAALAAPDPLPDLLRAALRDRPPAPGLADPEGFVRRLFDAPRPDTPPAPDR